MDLFAYPAVQGAVAGFLAAFVVDVQAWKSWQDARFNITTASWRWLQGAVLGALAVSGIGAVAG